MGLDKDFVEVMKEAGTVQGADPLMSDLFARIYLSPKPISMEELARLTGYSLSSVSNKLKMLLSAGIMNRVKKPGTKKVYIYMEKDIGKIMRAQMMKKEKAFSSILLAKLPDIVKKYGNDKSAAQEKVKIIKSYLRQIEQFQKMLNKFTKVMENM